MFKPTDVGDRKRYTYGRIKEVKEMPHLIDIQRKSYEWFIDEGLRDIFRDVSPIRDFSGKQELYIDDYELQEPVKDMETCKIRGETYASRMFVHVRLVQTDTGEMVSKKVLLVNNFPLMTPTGTFVINGAERVIVSQLVRSPGAYYDVVPDPSGRSFYSATIIPNRGAWIEFECDYNGIIFARLDRNRKFPVTTLLRILGLENDADIMEMFDNSEYMATTLEKDVRKDINGNTIRVNTVDMAMLEIFAKLRPGDPPDLDNARKLIENMLYDGRRYDFANVGRYKMNKKLGWKGRLRDVTLAADLVDHASGEVLLKKGVKVTREMLNDLEKKGVYTETGVDYAMIEGHAGPMKVVFTTNIPEERRTITPFDVFAALSYFINVMEGHGKKDDIDHLGNRRVRCVGELLQNQFRIGFARMERVVRERMNIQTGDAMTTPDMLMNNRPVDAAIKEFFGSSQLSQFMDQNNPLAELTHKRRLSALGPGGLSRDRAGYEVRDVHNSHYGRMCPIETPEGPNIGLIGSLSTYAVVNKYGFMETPYRRVDKKKKMATDEVVYMPADEEDNYTIAQANEPLDEKGRFVNARVTARRKDDVLSIPPEEVDYMDVSPKQVVSIATALIPFLQNDDANRALMGANMQRQAVPLLNTQAPIIGTGMEYKVAVDSGVCVLAKHAGKVTSATSSEIRVKPEKGAEDVYSLLKFRRSNQGTCINQRPVVVIGQEVKEGQVLADGPATDHGELALGHNVIVAYMPWEGYNYEDAVLLNEDLVKQDIFTSVHIEEYECEARDTKLGREEITRELPNTSDEAIKDLDEDGIIRIGAEVRPGDILVGKVTPKGETDLSAEERLLRAIFGEKAREVRDSSLRVPHGEAGKIVDVKVFSRENGDDLKPGINKCVRVLIAQKRKISAGDKMAGRHGNKGVVSRIMAREDMPFLPTGEPVHIVLNPLGVPSRMNIGQILENHLGWAARSLGMQIEQQLAELRADYEARGKKVTEKDKLNIPAVKALAANGYDAKKYGVPETVEIDRFGKESIRAIQIAVPVFDGAKDDDIAAALDIAGINETAKTVLYDGRTGEPFDNPVTVGLTYMLKLHHLVDDKIHARSTGPYSLVTQQPLGGKAQFGGQRFGEMEVWALEAYGAAYTLQEILTVKSDDVVGRVKTYEAIVKGDDVPEPGIPESFRVLVKELQAIGLDIKVLNNDGDEISLAQQEDEDTHAPRRRLTAAEEQAMMREDGEMFKEETEDAGDAANSEEPIFDEEYQNDYGDEDKLSSMGMSVVDADSDDDN